MSANPGPNQLGVSPIGLTSGPVPNEGRTALRELQTSAMEAALLQGGNLARYLLHGRRFVVDDFAPWGVIIGNGVTDARPAFLAARAAAIAAGGGIICGTPGSTYRLGDGYSEPGSFFTLTSDKLVFDGSYIRVIGNVIIGDLGDPSVSPRDAHIWGGEYEPDTSLAPFNPGRYFSYSNAVGIAAGVDCSIRFPLVIARQYVRAFSVQTDSTYTGNGGIPIQRFRAMGVVLVCDDAPDGLDISSAGADGLIQDVVIQAQIFGTPRRGVNMSSGGALFRLESIRADVEVNGSVDFAAQLYYLRNSDIRIRARNQQWAGFDVLEPTNSSFDLEALAVPTQNPANPPAGSGLAPNTNYGCAVSGTDATLVRMKRVVTFGPFFNGLLPARSGTIYEMVSCEGTSSSPVVSGPYGHYFLSVALKNTGGSPPAFSSPDEVCVECRVYDPVDETWQQVNPIDQGFGDRVRRGGNRTNNNGGVFRERALAVGSGLGGAAFDVGAGGSGFTEAFRMSHDGVGVVLGFYGDPGTQRPVISGSRSGNAALQSLLSALQDFGLLVDSTTA